MKVKMILPALTEATSPFWRPIRYSLFPPLGLATLAAYLAGDDQVEIQDEHVEKIDLDDRPDLVVIQAYITSASRAYRLADHYRRQGAHVALGGLHVTSLPDEAARHADTIVLGPGEDTSPRFSWTSGTAVPNAFIDMGDRGLPPCPDVSRGTGARVSPGVSGSLSMGIDSARSVGAWTVHCRFAACGVCGRLEEIRAKARLSNSISPLPTSACPLT